MIDTSKKIKRDIYTVDATDTPLGRLASDIAAHLIGKHRPDFEKHLDRGDRVIVDNFAKVKITGRNKVEQKTYYRHSGYPGGLKEKTLKALLSEDPKMVLEAAVSRMLPKNKHRTERMKRLTINV
jgi:large subunit ribosomal protein L13